MKKIFFVGNGKDFHALDWYRNIRNIAKGREIYFLTDLIQSEGSCLLINEEDKLLFLFKIDKFLFSKQTKQGNIWRNVVKFLFIPIQVYYLKSVHKKNHNAIFHAHTMYYMILCWLARIDFIGTPQGSEILVRPFKSKFYRYFATSSLKSATGLIVDSFNLKNVILRLSNKESEVIQYGIDVDLINSRIKINQEREKVVSIRGFYPNYRIDLILSERDNFGKGISLEFVYPFYEEGYRNLLSERILQSDADHGRFETKIELYNFLSNALLAISIPQSDSSPRSVYEAIFCGCAVAVTDNPWIELLPPSMSERLIVVNTNQDSWLKDSVEKARIIVSKEFIPCGEALRIFDQKESMKYVIEKYY